MIILRFIIGFATLLFASLAIQYAIGSFTTDPSAFGFEAAFDKVVKGIVTGFVILGFMRIFKGAEKTPDISRYTIYIAAVFIFLHAIYDLLTG